MKKFLHLLSTSLFVFTVVWAVSFASVAVAQEEAETPVEATTVEEEAEAEEEMEEEVVTCEGLRGTERSVCRVELDLVNSGEEVPTC